MVDQAVQGQSLKQYEAKFKAAEIFRESLRVGRPWSEATVFFLLAALEEAGYADTETWRSSVRHCLLARGRETEAQCFSTESVKKASRGVSLRAKLLRKPQGTVTESMFEDLVKWLREKGHRREATAAVVLYEAQLRVGELQGLQVGDVQEDTRKASSLLIRKNKGLTNRNVDKRNDFAKPISRELANFLERVGSGKKQGDLLFPEGERLERNIRKLIKQAAKDLGWPNDVEFRGPHSLRKGGTIPLLARAAELLGCAFANQSPGVFRRYQSTNRGPMKR